MPDMGLISECCKEERDGEEVGGECCGNCAGGLDSQVGKRGV